MKKYEVWQHISKWGPGGKVKTFRLRRNAIRYKERQNEIFDLLGYGLQYWIRDTTGNEVFTSEKDKVMEKNWLLIGGVTILAIGVGLVIAAIIFGYMAIWGEPLLTEKYQNTSLLSLVIGAFTCLGGGFMTDVSKD